VNYADALAWLYGTQGRGVKLGLERMREFLAALGWEQGSECFFHVAGTNGKGSVCAMLESICHSAGMRTGLYTSPHLVTFRERIRVNGEMAGEEEIAGQLTRIRETCERLDIEPTFFELATGLAFEIFRRAQLDVIVLETGLGGRLDSTNVIVPRVSVITSIGLDHTQILGGTISEIAREKAGIIKPGVPVICGPLPNEAAAVIAETAAERGAQLITLTEPELEQPVGLKGSHQRVNAALAARAIEAAGLEITPAQVAEGLRTVSWPGRFQDTGLGFILDGAHNPDAAHRLAETWREVYGATQTQIILGVLQDKDAAGVCSALAPIAEEFIIVPIKSPRSRPVEEMQKIAAGSRPSRACNSLAEAIATTRPGDPPALIAGSLFLVGEALVLLGLSDAEQEISAQ
jgi:dihydrofolate synthase/folylpolyglutamate synthase